MLVFYLLEKDCPRVIMLLLRYVNHPSSAALRILLLLDPAQRQLGVVLPVYTYILIHDPHHSLRISPTPLPWYTYLSSLRLADQFRGRGFAGPVLLAQCVDGIPR